IYLRAELLDANGARLSSQVAFFTLPRFIDFVDPRIRTEFRALSGGEAEITLRGVSLAPAVALGFGAMKVWLSDNWFDLPAGETHTVIARLPAGVGIDALRSALSITSL